MVNADVVEVSEGFVSPLIVIFRVWAAMLELEAFMLEMSMVLMEVDMVQVGMELTPMPTMLAQEVELVAIVIWEGITILIIPEFERGLPIVIMNV